MKDRVSVLTSMTKETAFLVNPSPPFLWYWEGQDPYHSLLGSAFPSWVLLRSSKTLHLQMVQVPSMDAQNSISLEDAGSLPHLLTQEWLWSQAGRAALSSPELSAWLCPFFTSGVLGNPERAQAWCEVLLWPPLPGKQLYARHVQTCTFYFHYISTVLEVISFSTKIKVH